ncbi:unnamed protein product, partial [Symbiodinium necroappetens]
DAANAVQHSLPQQRHGAGGCRHCAREPGGLRSLASDLRPVLASFSGSWHSAE